VPTLLPRKIDIEMTNWIQRHRASLRLAATVLCGALASCGGGSSQIEPFQPRQVILLGDDTVGLVADGRRYGMNGLDASNVFDCRLLPLWSQSLTATFGIVMDRCTTGTTQPPQAVTRATPLAKAGDLEAQITAQIASQALTSKDLFVLMIGLHDVIELYENFAGPKTCNPNARPETRTDLQRALAARGTQVADQINRLIAADARIIVSTLPDLGLTPYARSRELANPGDAALLSCMTATFNARVRVDPVQDGRFWGLVLADDLVQAMTNNPSGYGLSNATDAACTANPADPSACTSATLVSGATANSHLWADDRRLGPVAQLRLAELAISRARNNPF
jgi:outer membrane lipase/esterase